MNRKKRTTEERLAFIKNEKNRKTVADFIFALKSQGIKEKRIEKYCWQLRVISEWLGKDFRKAEKDDIVRVIATLEDQYYSELTKGDYKVCMKRFYKWLEGEDEEFPKKVKWIKAEPKNKVTVKPADILSKDEVIRMIDAARTMRDKAMIAVLYETGIRAGELLNMRIKDVKISESMVVISVDGKTGQRTVFMKGFRQHLLNWLNSHPRASDKNVFIWLNGRDKVISHGRLSKMLKYYALKSGMQKEKAMKVHAHLFRHSVATSYASLLTEQELKVLFGWSGGSRMASIYVHLSGSDIKDAVASKIYGEENGNHKDRTEAMLPVICSECGRENVSGSRFCNCGTVLDIRTAIELDKRLKKAQSVTQKLDMKNLMQEIDSLRSRLEKLQSA